jgi:hypothetical protein
VDSSSSHNRIQALGLNNPIAIIAVTFSKDTQEVAPLELYVDLIRMVFHCCNDNFNATSVDNRLGPSGFEMD